jgi:hypothetical protein
MTQQVAQGRQQAEAEAEAEAVFIALLENSDELLSEILKDHLLSENDATLYTTAHSNRTYVHRTSNRRHAP